MAPSFDPYYKWLGIPPEDQPPNYYRLLGIINFESDPDVIQSAADQRMAHLRTYQTGKFADYSQRLLNEVSAARICLLNATKKAAYDEQLQAALEDTVSAAYGSAVVSEVAVEIDEETRPRASATLHRNRSWSFGLIVGGATAVVALIGFLLSEKETPREVAKEPATVTEMPAKPASPPTPVQPPQVKKTEPEKKPPEKPVVTEPVKKPETKPSPQKLPTGKKPTLPNLSLVPDEGKQKPLEGPAVKSEETERTAKAAKKKGSDAGDDVFDESDFEEEDKLPSGEALEEAKKQARDLYRNELSKAKTPDDKQSLAKEILVQAKNAQKSDAGTYALLSLSLELAEQAADVETAFAAADLMADRFKTNVLKIKADALAACAKKVRAPAQHSLIAEQASQLLEEATAAGDYAQAIILAKVAMAEAVSSRNKELIASLKTTMAELQKKAKLAGDCKTAEETLASNPDDPAANLTAGLFYACIRDNWSKAIPCLAKCGDENLQSLAKREMAVSKNDSNAQASLADAWWDMGLAAEGMKRRAMLHHAQFWYDKALENGPNGLTKAKIEKRKDELSKLEHENVAIEKPTSPRVTFKQGRWVPLLTAADELTGWETIDCRFSYSNHIINLFERAMYYPVIARDVTIRAKVKRQNSVRVRLFLRDSDKGCYIAQIAGNDWSILKWTRTPIAKATPAQAHRAGNETILERRTMPAITANTVFEMGFSVVGNTLTVFANRQPVLQAKDAAFTEGMAGIGTDYANGLFITGIELLIPKGSLVADHRASTDAGKP
jgi:outer membrane biosynthesis protein TonB